MTRKEEILKAARDYVSGVTLSSPSNVIHFEAGAEWSDEHPNLESLWHDASEMPKEGEFILVQFDEDCYDTLVLCDLGADIFYARCKKYGDIRWAYISDLLPKGGEE